MSRLVVCAWCLEQGPASGAVRPPAQRLWRAASHAFVRAATAAGLASHGVCTACRRRLEREIDAAAPAADTHGAAGADSS